jgi:hypothetical protein
MPHGQGGGAYCGVRCIQLREGSLLAEFKRWIYQS